MKKLVLVTMMLLSSGSFLYSQEKGEVANSQIKVKIAEVPKFDNPEVQQFAIDYHDFIQDYIVATKTKDQELMKETAIKSQKIAQQTSYIFQIFKEDPEEVKKFSNYIQLLEEELQKASQTNGKE